MKITEVTNDFFECDDGWNNIIYEALDRIKALDSNIEVYQIKEKFGGLRIYLGAYDVKYDDAIEQIILEAETKAWDTCEKCGQPGTLRNDIGWILTLCDNCYQEVLERKKNRGY